MNTFLITYDLAGRESLQDYQKLHDHIKTSYSNWARPAQSVWLINTNEKVAQTRDNLRQLVDENDKILVIDVTRSSWATYNISKVVIDWMENNL